MVKTLLQPAVRLCICMASSIHHPRFIQRHEHHMHASLTRAQMTGWPHVRAVDNFIQNIRNRRLFISFPSSLFVPVDLWRSHSQPPWHPAESGHHTLTRWMLLNTLAPKLDLAVPPAISSDVLCFRLFFFIDSLTNCEEVGDPLSFESQIRSSRASYPTCTSTPPPLFFWCALVFLSIFSSVRVGRLDLRVVAYARLFGKCRSRPW